MTQPLRVDEIAVRPLDGGVFAEGTLALRAASGEVIVASASGEPVGVTCRASGWRTSLMLFDRIVQAPDGFRDAGPPRMQVSFEQTVPDLFAMLGSTAQAGRHRMSAEGTRLVSVRWLSAEPRERGHRDLYADGFALDLRLAVEVDGLRVAFEAPIVPSRNLPEQTLPFDAAVLSGDVLLPAAWCRLQGFVLPIGFPGGGYTSTGPWTPSGPGLGSVAANSHGAPFCEGKIDWGSRRGDTTGPYVELFLRGRELVARPASKLSRVESGFATGSRDWSDGPELALHSGFEDWALMLEDREQAEIAMKGTGIGHVDGQTGRSVGECGGHMRQPIRFLRLRLERRRDGLLVAGEGALEPLAGDSAGRSLGPELRFEWLVPRAWILARGLPIRGFREDRKKEFPSEGTW